MSAALVCDNCDSVLAVNRRGEAANGEESAWIRLHIANIDLDLCTRSCAAEVLERDDVVAAHDEYAAVIAGIARAIEGDDEATS